MKFIFAISLLLVAPISAFQARETSRCLLSSTRPGRKALSPLYLSLEDNWEAAFNAIKSSDPSPYTPDTPFELTIPGLDLSSQEWLSSLMATFGSLSLFYRQLPLALQIAAIAVPAFTTAFFTLYNLSFPATDYRATMEPYVRGSYDPIQAKAYYKRHKLLVLQRVLQLLRLSNKFLLNQAVDKYILKREEKMRPQRARELLELITRLGPTAIKVGQALSVRPDLIPEEFANALSSLQDQVPPFDNAEAKALLLSQLGRERYAKLEQMSAQPVASASIGQVYRGIVDDRDVAIKVQRPNVLAEIALDLYIVRQFAPIYQKFTGGATDLQSLASEWGRGFIAELNYVNEAANTIKFNEGMKQRNLNAVCAPVVVEGYSTEQILVTEWVDGTRLDMSDATDVPRLCSVALNAYLVMLLELQSLHCDPHPGNLLRTQDGRLCILDFGMTLDIDPDLQYSLLEFVAHLTSEDYTELPEDLMKLGFLKPEKVEFARRSGVLEPLKYFLRQAGQGGGADAVRDRIFDEYRAKFPGLTDDELRVEMRAEMKQQVNEVIERESVATGITIEVEELQKQNRDSFRVPEWFLYTSRAFLTLEGVSLQADPDYSIIRSCFPYVAKRLVGDDDPRARKALKDLIYGASNTVDVDRLSDLAQGFSSYTTTTKSINQQATGHDGELVLTDGNFERISKDQTRKRRLVEAESTITLMKDSADIILAREGNLVQNLLVEESALAASANLKDSVRNTFVEAPKRFRDSLPFGAGTFLPPLPFEDQLEPFVQKSDAELKAQRLAEKIAKIAPGDGNVEPPESSANIFSPHRGQDESATTFVEQLRQLEPEQAALVLKEVRENLPRYAPLVGELGSKFVSKLLKTANTNIETTLDELEKEGRHTDQTFRATARSFAKAAERGASALEAERESESPKKT